MRTWAASGAPRASRDAVRKLIRVGWILTLLLAIVGALGVYVGWWNA